MAPLLEHHVKHLLSRHGLAVPAGAPVDTPAQAAGVAESLGYPIVVKALVPVGKKQRSGAVQFVDTSADLEAALTAVLGQSFRGFAATTALVEKRETVVRELFLSLTFDGRQRGPALLLSTAGGVDVETAAANLPAAFAHLPVDIRTGPNPAVVAAAWQRLGLAPAEAEPATLAVSAAWDVFRTYEAKMLEINPLALAPGGRAIALGALMDIDDEALFRQTEVAGWVAYGGGRFGGRLPTALERELLDRTAAETSGSIRFMELAGGDLGCLMFGGGCSLYAIDRIIAAGGRPATYYDATSPPPALERAVMEGVLRLPRLRGLLFGCNVLIQRPIIAGRTRNLIDALKACQVDARSVPVVVRLAGAGEAAAREIAESVPGVVFCGGETSIDAAVELFLGRVRSSGGEGRP